MSVSWALVTGPATEPVTTAEAKAQARITDTNSDSLIASYITVARQTAEEHLGYGLFTQTWRLDLDQFSDVIPLPMALQLQSITSVKYYDTDGTLQTLSTDFYETDTISRPCRLVRKADVSWPSLQADRRVGLVQITYVVGWDDVADIPERIKQGIKLYVTYLDMNRDGLIDATHAEAAARNCWADRIYYVEPACR